MVGRPQVEDVEPARGPIGDRTRPVVLYAPTWRGHIAESELSSLAVGERIVAALLARDVTVVFRSHPLSRAIPEDAAVVHRIGALLAADAARTGRPHRCGAAAETEVGILDCLNDSDAMVTDVSSVVSDYLFSTKPFAMIAVPAEPTSFVEQYPVARASYVVRGDLADLEPQLDALLGADPLAERRAAVRADYLGDFDTAHYAEGFVDAVREVCRLGPIVRSADPARLRSRGRSGAVGADGRPVAAPRAGTAPEDAGPLGKRRALVVATAQLAGTLMAAAALAIALLGGPGWLVSLVVLAGSAELFWASTASLRHPGQWVRLLDQAPAARVALLLAGPLVAIQAADGTGMLAAGWIARAGGSARRGPDPQGWLGGLLVRRLRGLEQPIRPGPSRALVPVLGLGFGLATALLAIGTGPVWLARSGWLRAGRCRRSGAGDARWSPNGRSAGPRSWTTRPRSCNGHSARTERSSWSTARPRSARWRSIVVGYRCWTRSAGLADRCPLAGGLRRDRPGLPRCRGGRTDGAAAVPAWRGGRRGPARSARRSTSTTHRETPTSSSGATSPMSG